MHVSGSASFVASLARATLFMHFITIKVHIFPHRFGCGLMLLFRVGICAVFQLTELRKAFVLFICIRNVFLPLPWNMTTKSLQFQVTWTKAKNSVQEENADDHGNNDSWCILIYLRPPSQRVQFSRVQPFVMSVCIFISRSPIFACNGQNSTNCLHVIWFIHFDKLKSSDGVGVRACVCARRPVFA